ncbi:MAG TPA: RluA family pseudouridine synthase [Dehalococcoidales bacterium]
MSGTVKEFHFTVEQAGVRLDKYVSEVCPDLSRTQAQKLIEGGQVAVNGNQEKASYKLSAGDTVLVKIPPPTSTHLTPENIPVPILYEDDDILVVDKPAGLTVHPAPGHTGHTLVNAILSHLTTTSDSTQRPGIVHRLDKDTSGVMVIARNPKAHDNLASQFKQHTVKKVYLTLVRGHLTPEEGIIEAPIGRDTGDRKKMAISGESRGRKALTRYKVIHFLGNYTLLEVMPQTGRTHQIRVHLTAIGYPVVGDAIYGVKSPFLSRQFLHAHKLGFRLPSTGKYLEFTSPLPEDLEKALKTIS